MLSDAINSYTWSTDGDLTARAPKAGGVAYNFTSTFVAPTRQMRLNNASGGDGTVINFYYDPFQRLISQQGSAGNSWLFYDGPDSVLKSTPGAGGTTQWSRYVHGPGDDQPLATEVYPAGAAPTPGTGSQYYYHADGEGSIRLLTDATGAVANQYSYARSFPEKRFWPSLPSTRAASSPWRPAEVRTTGGEPSATSGTRFD